MLTLYKLPQKHLLSAIPIVLVLGLVIGHIIDTTFLKPTIMVATIIMIYATMIGMNFREVASIQNSRLVVYATLFNFTVVPAVGLLIGKSILVHHEIMFAGLMLIALLPTSGMTISWTAMQKGNIPSAITLTIFGLFVGSLVTPFYLSTIVGQGIEINMINIFFKIVMIVFIPMVLGHITYKVLLLRYTADHFKKEIKPTLSPLSLWAMLYIVFVSISMKADTFLTNPAHIYYSVIATAIFYFINYIIATIIARRAFNREDGIAFVNGTVLRNLSIAIGISAMTFGSEATAIITIAFMIQQQTIAYYAKVSKKFWFHPEQCRPIFKKMCCLDY